MNIKFINYAIKSVLYQVSMMPPDERNIIADRVLFYPNAANSQWHTARSIESDIVYSFLSSDYAYVLNTENRSSYKWGLRFVCA